MTKEIIELLYASKQAISDFEQYGEVWQTDENNEYGKYSSYGRLQRAIKAIEKLDKKGKLI
jgi:hypothetical protein